MKQPKLGFVAMRVHDCEMDIAVDFFIRLGYNVARKRDSFGKANFVLPGKKAAPALMLRVDIYEMTQRRSRVEAVGLCVGDVKAAFRLVRKWAKQHHLKLEVIGRKKGEYVLFYLPEVFPAQIILMR